MGAHASGDHGEVEEGLGGGVGASADERHGVDAAVAGGAETLGGADRLRVVGGDGHVDDQIDVALEPDAPAGVSGDVLFGSVMSLPSGSVRRRT